MLRKNNIISLVLLFIANCSWAEIYLPLNQQGVLKAKSLVEKGEGQFIFSQSEREYLVSNGKEALSYSIESETSLGSKNFKVEKNHSLSFDRPALLNQSFEKQPFPSDSHSEQWALNNRGGGFELALSEIDVVNYQGKKGEDIQLQELPEETDRIIKVAVLDTGIDYSHPDLKGMIHQTPSECKALLEYGTCLDQNPDKQICHDRFQKLDSDGNGYPLDCSGWNVTKVGDQLSTGIRGNNDASDQVGHGTHVAGIIAALRDGKGVSGISSKVKILPVKVLDETEDGRSGLNADLPGSQERGLPELSSFGDVVARGFLYALRSGADIINMSLGWSRGVDSQLIRELISLANEQGVLVVASAGNDSNHKPIFPCIYPEVICVAGHSADGSLSTITNFGPSVDIAAPGHHILSTWPQDRVSYYFTERRGYEFLNGTSMAAPHVVGGLVRLLNQGYSPSESRSRLLLGARQSLKSSIDINANSKFTQSGNLSLAGAFEVQPRPFILPKQKGPLFFVWDGEAQEITAKVKLKNYWVIGKKILVNISMKDSSHLDLAIETSEFTLDEFDQNQEIEIPLSLKILNQNLGSEFDLVFEYRDEDQRLGKFYLQAEIIVPILPNKKRANSIEYPITLSDGVNINPDSQINTILDVVSGKPSDYLVFYENKRRKTWEFTLLKREKLENGNFQFTGKNTKKLKVGRGKLLGLYKLDIDGDDLPNYVLGLEESKRNRAGDDDRTNTRKQARFEFYDQDFNQVDVQFAGQNQKSFTYDNETSILPANFNWVKTNNGFSLAWITNGLLPEAEIPTKFDPFGEPFKNSQKIRFYYIGKEGLKTLKAPEGYDFVEILTTDQSQREEGVLPVLLVKGSDFDRTFYLSEVKDFQFGEVKPLLFPQYHMIGGLDPLETLSLNPVDAAYGTSFGGLSSLNRYKLTSIGHLNREIDYHQSNIKPLNSLYRPHRLSGVFVEEDSMKYFVQTQYSLEFKDTGSGEQFSTSLKRFSFLPGYFFDNFFLPVAVEHGDKYLPAMTVPSGLGVSLSTEVIMPRIEDGEVVGLYRPAKFRNLPAGGCHELNFERRRSNEPAKLVYFCGNKIILMKLKTAPL